MGLITLLSNDPPTGEPSTITVNGQTLIVNPPGHQSKKQNVTLDIHSWMQAYSAYAAALTSAEETSKPESAGLLAHMYNVLQLARDLEGNQWVQYDKAFREWAAAKEVRAWGKLNLPIFCHSASVWQLNRDQHPSLESSPGQVIHHTQEGLGGTGCGNLRIPVQDELVASFTTPTSVRVPTNPPIVLQGQRRVRVTLYFASNYH